MYGSEKYLWNFLHLYILKTFCVRTEIYLCVESHLYINHKTHLWVFLCAFIISETDLTPYGRSLWVEARNKWPVHWLPSINKKHVHGVKAGTHWPNRWTSEAFGETRTRSGTNMFGLLSSVGSFRSRVDVVGSNWACEVWWGEPSDVWAIGFSDWLCDSWMAVLIGGVLANHHAVWEWRNTVCFVFLCTSFHHSPFSCFAVLARNQLLCPFRMN